MREYIFTPHEKTILINFLEGKGKGSGFRVLITRMRKNADFLCEELNLLKSVLNKL